MGYPFKRVARSLTVLKNEVDLTYPDRPKGMDGALGDTAHANRVSDHNPNRLGIVCALDLTEWVIRGVEMNDVLADFLRWTKDPRIKYVISDGQMFSSYGTRTRDPWEWGPYRGVNDHTKHVHISVHGNYDDTKPWGFKKSGPAKQVLPVLPLLKKDEQMEILDLENSPDHYVHVIGQGLIKMTDARILGQYQKTYATIEVNEGWIRSLQDLYK